MRGKGTLSPFIPKQLPIRHKEIRIRDIFVAKIMSGGFPMGYGGGGPT